MMIMEPRLVKIINRNVKNNKKNLVNHLILYTKHKSTNLTICYLLLNCLNWYMLCSGCYTFMVL